MTNLEITDKSSERQFSLRAIIQGEIVWGQLFSGHLSEGQLSGGNNPGGNYAGGGAIIRGEFSSG